MVRPVSQRAVLELLVHNYTNQSRVAGGVRPTLGSALDADEAVPLGLHEELERARALLERVLEPLAT